MTNISASPRATALDSYIEKEPIRNAEINFAQQIAHIYSKLDSTLRIKYVQNILAGMHPILMDEFLFVQSHAFRPVIILVYKRCQRQLVD